MAWTNNLTSCNTWLPLLTILLCGLSYALPVTGIPSAVAQEGSIQATGNGTTVASIRLAKRKRLEDERADRQLRALDALLYADRGYLVYSAMMLASTPDQLMVVLNSLADPQTPAAKAAMGCLSVCFLPLKDPHNAKFQRDVTGPAKTLKNSETAHWTISEAQPNQNDITTLELASATLGVDKDKFMPRQWKQTNAYHGNHVKWGSRHTLEAIQAQMVLSYNEADGALVILETQSPRDVMQGKKDADDLGNHAVYPNPEYNKQPPECPVTPLSFFSDVMAMHIRHVSELKTQRSARAKKANTNAELAFRNLNYVFFPNVNKADLSMLIMEGALISAGLDPDNIPPYPGACFDIGDVAYSALIDMKGFSSMAWFLSQCKTWFQGKVFTEVCVFKGADPPNAPPPEKDMAGVLWKLGPRPENVEQLAKANYNAGAAPTTNLWVGGAGQGVKGEAGGGVLIEQESKSEGGGADTSNYRGKKILSPHDPLGAPTNKYVKEEQQGGDEGAARSLFADPPVNVSASASGYGRLSLPYRQGSTAPGSLRPGVRPRTGAAPARGSRGTGDKQAPADEDMYSAPRTRGRRGTEPPALVKRQAPKQAGASRGQAARPAQAQAGPVQPPPGPPQTQAQADLSMTMPATSGQMKRLTDEGYNLFDKIMFALDAKAVTDVIQGMHLNKYADEKMNQWQWQADSGPLLISLAKALVNWEVTPLAATDCSIAPVNTALDALSVPLQPDDAFQCYSWVQDKTWHQEHLKWGATMRTIPATNGAAKIAYNPDANAVVVLSAVSPLERMREWHRQGNAAGFPTWIKDKRDPRYSQVEDELPVPRLHKISDIIGGTILTIDRRAQKADSPVVLRSETPLNDAVAGLKYIVYQSIQDSGEHMQVIAAILSTLGQRLSPWPGLQCEIGDYAFNALIATDKFQDVAWYSAQRRKIFGANAVAAYRVHIFRGDGDGPGVPSVLWKMAQVTEAMKADAARREETGLVHVEGQSGGQPQGNQRHGSQAVEAGSLGAAGQPEESAEATVPGPGEPGNSRQQADKGKRPLLPDSTPPTRSGLAPGQRPDDTVGTTSDAGSQSYQPNLQSNQPDVQSNQRASQSNQPGAQPDRSRSFRPWEQR